MSKRVVDLCALFVVVTAVHCTGDDVASQAAAIHGTGDAGPSNDTASLAVGVVDAFGGTCAASLIAEDASGGIGLTAAHCFFALGQRCASEAAVTNGAAFAVSTSGALDFDLSDATDVYDIDRIVTHPSAFTDCGACPEGTKLACDSKLLTGAGNDSVTSDPSHDVALFHFHVRPGPGHNLPSALGITPVAVLTSITDATVSRSECTRYSIKPRTSPRHRSDLSRRGGRKTSLQ